MVVQFAEVLLAHPVQRGSVQLGGAADEVVHLRLEEGLALRVIPAILRDVPAVDEHVHGRPVRRLAGQPVAALEQQDPLARRGQVAGQRTTAGPGPDHDDVVMSVHAVLLPRLGKGWNRWCWAQSMRVTRPGRGAAHGRRIRPPMITAQRWLSCSFMAPLPPDRPYCRVRLSQPGCTRYPGRVAAGRLPSGPSCPGRRGAPASRRRAPGRRPARRPRRCPGGRTASGPRPAPRR